MSSYNKKAAKCGVYLIHCSANNKVYIGSSNYIQKRLQNHRNHLRGNKHQNEHLQSAFNKYGKDSFSYSIIELCEESKLIERETYWVEQYEAYKVTKGFNKTLPGTLPPKCDGSYQRKPRKLKPVIIINNTTNERVECLSLREACDRFNLVYKKAQEALYGGRKTHRGYVLVRKEDYEENRDYKVTRPKITFSGKSIIAVHRDTGEVLEFDSGVLCAKALGRKSGDVSLYIKNGWAMHGYLLKFKDQGDTK